MTRVSVKEAYSNRDLIAQIARLKTYVEQGTFKEVSTSYSGGVLVLTFTAYDDSTQSFNIPMDSIVGITGDQVGNTVTLHVEFASGTVVDIPYTIANADTSPIPDTLGLRDGSGKLYAADPASGATDKTLVTANWISQTGNSSPNNALHRSGYETKSAPFTVDANSGSNFPLEIKAKTTPGSILSEQCDNFDVTDGVQHYYPNPLRIVDRNGVTLARVGLYSFPNGRVQLKVYVRNSDGSLKDMVLLQGDTI